jgi:D-beta-D-heptose 7-phosphate kinase/D-beta-D-heptose 1-phosphate adenosyltransferase
LPNLSSTLDAFPASRIAVVGDLMLDEYLWGHIERISPEAPVPILSVTHRTSTLGGAGNVAENLRHWGAEVTLIGVVGSDETARQLHDLLQSHGVNATGVLTDPLRKTTRKARLMSVEHGQQVFRLDEESTITVKGEIENSLIGAIRKMDQNVQAIVCSDYLKGVLSEKVLAAVFEVARSHGIRSIVAPKDSNAEKYRGANILMPNSTELRQMTPQRANQDANRDVWLDASARSLVEVLALEALLVTRGSEGMSLFENSSGGLRRVDIPTMARSVYDVTGAGDTAIAAFTAAVASGADLGVAAQLANLSAGIKVGKRGTACVDLEEIRASLKEVRASHDSV